MQSQTPSYNVPDRLTGLQEVEELRRLCPGRTWNFVSTKLRWAIHEAYQEHRMQVEVNVPYEVSHFINIQKQQVLI